MPVSALGSVSTARNGVGAFIPQCKRIDLRYSDWGGSSRGMRAFLKSTLLKSFAQGHPQIQVHVSPCGNDHPSLVGHYINGRQRQICVRKYQKERILQEVERLGATNGQKETRITGGKRVQSLNASVRGVWDEFHPPSATAQNTFQQRVEAVGAGLLGEKKKK